MKRIGMLLGCLALSLMVAIPAMAANYESCDQQRPGYGPGNYV